MAAIASPRSSFDWRQATVSGRQAWYGVAGEGPPVLFLHGWGLNHRSYARALERLADQGVTVYAPALPGFGGTDELPKKAFSLSGYAAWVRRFAETVGIPAPVTVIGHSFGGGVAIRLAHDTPALVRQLVLVNSIGGSVWTDRSGRTQHLRDRPLWDWGLHLPAEAMSVRSFTRIAPVVLGDAIPNFLRQPRTVWKVGGLARSADLTSELVALRDRRLPVVILWGMSDAVLPLACLESLRAALGDPVVRTVQGAHGWLLVDPGRFAEEMTNVLGLATPA